MHLTIMFADCSAPRENFDIFMVAVKVAEFPEFQVVEYMGFHYCWKSRIWDSWVSRCYWKFKNWDSWDWRCTEWESWDWKSRNWDSWDWRCTKWESRDWKSRNWDSRYC